MIIGVHPLGVELDGASEVGARLGEFEQGKLAMAALGVKLRVVG
jgi:hypothetical protein